MEQLIGFNQNAFHRDEGGFPSFEEMIRSVAELGFNMYEFCPEFPEQTPDALTPQRRREALSLSNSLGLKLNVHASFASVNPCFMNDHTRAESIRQLKREIELAHDLESEIITIHPGPPTMHARWYSPEIPWQTILRSFEELLLFAEPLGVCICAENVFSGFIGKEASLIRLFDEIDSPFFGLTFDFGHHNVIYNDSPLAERTAAMIRIMGRFKDKIRELHLHDNNGAGDEHWHLGSGVIDYHAGIREARRLGIEAKWCLESTTIESVLKSKAALSDYL